MCAVNFAANFLLMDVRKACLVICFTIVLLLQIRNTRYLYLQNEVHVSISLGASDSATENGPPVKQLPS